MRLLKRILCIILVFSVLSVPIHSHAEPPEESSEDNAENVNPDEGLSPLDLGSITIANTGIATRIVGEEKFSFPTGHGWAAERGNTRIDRLRGLNASVVGDNNIKNGADRLIKQGGQNILIQTKYYSTASGGISACFDEAGIFRYLDADGKPMQIEVPKDQYNSAVELMKARIRRGQVPGVTDPEEAKNLIRKGSLTYKQAVNLAKPGTIQSLKYDAQSGIVSAGSAFGISVVLTFGISMWNGESVEESLKVAAKTGLKTAGTVFVTSVLSSQLSRAGATKAFAPAADKIVKMLGPKATAALANAFAPTSTSSAGSAAKNFIKSNLLVATVTIAVLSMGDVIRLFRGRISASQLFKNLAVTAASVGGGAAGYMAGGAIGTMIAPGVGTGLGIVLGIVLGVASGYGAQQLIDHFTESDAEQMLTVIEERFYMLAGDYLLKEEEATVIIDNLAAMLNEEPSILLDMFASEDRESFADELLIPLFDKVASARATIELPTEEEMTTELISLLEDVVFIH